jgi:hypothetical protein
MMLDPVRFLESLFLGVPTVNTQRLAWEILYLEADSADQTEGRRYGNGSSLTSCP